MKEIETTPKTPEELLRMLDLQMAVQRAQRGTSGRNRAMLLVGGLLFIFIAGGLALLVLSQMLADLPHDARRPAAPAQAEPAAGNF